MVIMANSMQKVEEKEFKGPWLGGRDEVGNPIWVWKNPAEKKVEPKKIEEKVVESKIKKAIKKVKKKANNKKKK